MIVESPAKAKTIERYLGPGYTVLASYGHVRDLPENPGKGKLGVDVEHDFAPTYEISPDRHRQLAAIEKAARGAGKVYLATDLDREGEAIAWHVSEAIGLTPERTAPGDLQRDHRVGDQGGLRSPAPDRPGPGRRPADPPDRGPDGGLHAQPAHLAQGPFRPVGRSGPVGRGPSRGRSRARDPRLRGGRVLDDRGPPGGTRWRALQRRAGQDRRPEAGHRRCRDRRATRRGAAREPAGRRWDRGQALEAEPGTAVHHLDPPAGGQPQARVQPEADDVRRPAAVRGRRHTRRPDGPHHLHADRLGRALGAGHGRGARGHRRSLRQRLHDAQGPPVQDEDPQRPGGPRGRAADVLPARPRGDGQGPGPGRGPPLSADLAARPGQPDEGEGARDDDRRAVGRRLRPAGERHEDRVRRLQPGLHRRPGRFGRGGRAGPPATRPGRRHGRGRGRSDPALHGAAAALHRGDPDQGARGARDRPSVDLRGHDLDDRRPGLRHGRRTTAPPGADRGGRDRPPGRSLRALRRSCLHRPDGGRARRDRPRRATVGPAPARVLRAAQGAGRREALRPAPQGLHDRAIRRGLLGGAPDGRPARAQREVPGLLALSGAQGIAAAARRGGGGPGPARRRRGLSQVRGRRGRHARRQARPVRAVRRLLALSRLRLHQEGRSAAARSAALRGDLPPLQGRPPDPAPGA